MTLPELRVPDPGRIDADLDALAQITEPGQPGWTRRAMSEADRASREWSVVQLRDLGLDPRVDAAGNVIGRLPGRVPGKAALMTGSHTDTVEGGGRFDGIAGFVGALEVVRLLRESGVQLERDLLVVNFFNEEPNRFGLSCVGSRAMTGQLRPEHLALTDPDGVTFADALAGAGTDVGDIGSAQLPPGRIRAFLELHIEQGPMLEEQAAQIGLVTSITGVSRFAALFHGERGHAGTTSMRRRRDAGCAAAGTVLAVERIASVHDHCRGTTGSISFTPDAVNVVSDQAQITGELRSPDPEWLRYAHQELAQSATDEAEKRSVTIDFEWLSNQAPTPMDDELLELMEGAVRGLGYAQSRLYSGAEHDAAVLARVCPTGMVFVPSRDGRSHCPQEWTGTSDLVAGIHTLVTSLVQADRLLTDQRSTA